MFDTDMPFQRPGAVRGSGAEESAFDRVRISIASPEVIRDQWSYGEVKKPETINHRSLKPERDGLFCARIFGPMKDFECLCGRYKRQKHQAITCDKCGVEVTRKKVRRERMGHIELAAPVAHVWFLKSTSSSIGLMLGMRFEELKRIVYFEDWVVIEPGSTDLRPRQVLTEEEYEAARKRYGEGEFEAGTGAEAVRTLLENLNGDSFVEEIESLKQRFDDLKRELRVRRLLPRLARALEPRTREPKGSQIPAKPQPARALRLRPLDIEKILTWRAAVVLDPGGYSRLAEGQIITADRLARVGERYASKGALFASGPSGLRDFIELHLARKMEIDKGLYEEAISVLRPFLEAEREAMEDDVRRFADENVDLIAREEALVETVGLEEDAYGELLAGTARVELLRRGIGVSVGEVVRPTDPPREKPLSHSLTGMVAIRFLIDAARRKTLRAKGEQVVGKWSATQVSRLVRLAEASDGALPGENVNEKELKQILAGVNERRRFLTKFLESGNRPEWMILKVLPVIPPDLRPLVHLDGGRFATSDLNELYRRVINRNNRLRKLIEQKAPEIIVRNEKRMLQRSVDALLSNGSIGEASRDSKKRPLKSFSDILMGKQGRFRQNLLGKRVDFSGRTVIVVGPQLKLHQCGLPKRMALELFKPFIFAYLDKRGVSPTIKTSKRMVEEETDEVWEALNEVTREHPVLLNRAPTLHRLGIQAFEPVLIEGKAIQLHPLVCAAFNADFDGDNMAVHVPLSLEAQLEARVLMMSTNNILSPADGKPVIVPSQDIVLGIYYQSLMLDEERDPRTGKPVHVFASMAEAEHAAFVGQISPQSLLRVRLNTFDENGKPAVRRYDTTLGRLRLAALLPRNPLIRFDIVNRELRKNEVRELIDTVYRNCGQKETVVFCDRIMQLGFGEACRAGISVGMQDLIVPPEKRELIEETQKQVDGLERDAREHLITAADKYNKAVGAWTNCTDRVSDAVVRELEKPKTVPGTERKVPNSVYMMMHSGARGSKDQMKQIAGMRGLMSKPSGEIIDKPIVANFVEGLSVREYFYSTHGARKGQTDTALKTSRSGYFTRRLVYLAYGCVVQEDDCGTENGIDIEAVVPGERHPIPLSSRLLGRVALEDVVDEATGTRLLAAGKMIKEDESVAIEQAGIPRVRVRSALTCESVDGICAQCYGRDLARGELVNLGEPVGIIAAQSIGEPGTQLTMRTFHSGGAAAVSDRTYLESPVSGSFEVRNTKVVVDERDRPTVLGRNAEVAITDESGREFSVEQLPHGARISGGKMVKGVARGKVEAGDRIAEWDPYNHVVIAEQSGKVVFEDFYPGLTYREDVDEATGSTRRTVIDWSGSAGGAGAAHPKVRRTMVKPSILLVDKSGAPLRSADGVELKYLLSVGAMILVEDGEKVKAGKAMARVPRHSATSTDITGGLPRMEALFNAHGTKEDTCAIIAGMDGKVRLDRALGNKRKLIIEPTDPSLEPGEYSVPKNRHIAVADGESIRRGEYLIDGDPELQDILDVFGEEEGQLRLARYLIDESHRVYRAQGVEINDKHIEVIVRQLLRKVKIVDPGDTHFLEDQRVDRSEYLLANREAAADGLKPATGMPVVRRYFDKQRRDTNSFIAEASFVETQRVLTRAAAEGEVDELLGLQENVVVGRLIPAGTGLISKQIRREAMRRDREIQQAQRERESAQRALSGDSLAKDAFLASATDGTEETPNQPSA